MRGIEQIPWLYDGLMAILDRLGLGAWRAELAVRADSPLLEVGCGTGRTLSRYPTGAGVIGLDPDPRMLLRARRRAPEVPLVIARAEDLPFRDACFDTVVCSLVFCSVADVPRGLSEIRRVLKPGGRLCMLEHVRPRHPLLSRMSDWLQPAWTCLAGGCHPNRDTEAAVVRAGFRIDGEGRRCTSVMRMFTARLPGSGSLPDRG